MFIFKACFFHGFVLVVVAVVVVLVIRERIALIENEIRRFRDQCYL